MSLVKYVDRRNTNSVKWDGQTNMYGEEGPVLHCTKVEPAEEAQPEVATF